MVRFDGGLKGCFTLWSSKSRSCGIEWPNFVESPKKWAENMKMGR